MALHIEILNIQFHIKRLVLKALNKCKTDAEAAKELGISIRSLYLYKKEFKIIKDSKGQLISVKEQEVNAVVFEA
ncbi:helix-turn-helix domain-containing protein [Ferruginibacter yonginensis]|uniref:Helix-turn-helix domain-containing protein n=1 Tax=Ferruginibacter yonginensis TaxID=1310416 RepID=A0ABV8QQ77_9BACT